MGFLYGSNEMNLFLGTVFFLIGFPFIFALLFACFDLKILKSYYANLNLKTANLFQAEIYDYNHSITKMGKYDLYIKINKEEFYPIEFHVPKKKD